MRRLVTIGISVAAAVLASAGPARACETYTIGDDGFGLERGIQWAFAGTVVRESLNAETGRPDAVVVRVDRTLAGIARGRELTIDQDAGCDGFWYRAGDEVVVAVPFHAGLDPHPSETTGLDPGRRPVTNYQVAVWVLDGDRVAIRPLPHSVPLIDGRRPATRDGLLAALERLPDTATVAAPGGPPDDAGPAPLVIIVIGAAAGSVALRRAGSRRR